MSLLLLFPSSQTTTPTRTYPLAGTKQAYPLAGSKQTYPLGISS